MYKHNRSGKKRVLSFGKCNFYYLYKIIFRGSISKRQEYFVPHRNELKSNEYTQTEKTEKNILQVFSIEELLD